MKMQSFCNRDTRKHVSRIKETQHLQGYWIKCEHNYIFMVIISWKTQWKPFSKSTVKSGRSSALALAHAHLYPGDSIRNGVMTGGHIRTGSAFSQFRLYVWTYAHVRCSLQHTPKNGVSGNRPCSIASQNIYLLSLINKVLKLIY